MILLKEIPPAYEYIKSYGYSYIRVNNTSGATTYIKVINEMDAFELDPGMIAIVTRIQGPDSLDLVKFNLAVPPELQKLNEPFAKRDFYDESGKACLTYLEAEKLFHGFKDGDTFKTFIFDCENPEECTPCIELYNPSKWFEEFNNSQFDGSYVEFLEYKLNLCTQ